MWRSRRSKQKKDIVIIVNVTTCIYNAFSSNWHRKSCVIFHELYMSASDFSLLWFLWRHAGRTLSLQSLNKRLRESKTFYAEFIHQVCFRCGKLSVEKLLSCPWQLRNLVITIKCNEMWEFQLQASTCYQLLCNNLAISCLHLKRFLPHFMMRDSKRILLLDFGLAYPFTHKRIRFFVLSHRFMMFRKWNIFLNPFCSMHNTRIIANKCARMFIFIHALTSILMHHFKLRVM